MARYLCVPERRVRLIGARFPMLWCARKCITSAPSITSIVSRDVVMPSVVRPQGRTLRLSAECELSCSQVPSGKGRGATGSNGGGVVMASIVSRAALPIHSNVQAGLL